MTATGTTTAFVPSGHPVRRASIVLGVVVLALVAVWAGGLINPRLAVSGSGATRDSRGHGRLILDLHNQGLGPVEIASVSIPGFAIDDTSLGSEPLGRGPTLGADETRKLIIRYVSDTCDAGPSNNPTELTISTTTALGLTRAVVLRGTWLPTQVPCR